MRSTSAPYTSAIFAKRSPNDPIDTPSTRSPGDRTLTTAASRPPVPAHDRIPMSPAVPKYGFMPAWIRARIAAKSGLRWLIICRPPTSRTLGGRPVGPGIRRLGSKRDTGASGDQVEGRRRFDGRTRAVGLSYRDHPRSKQEVEDVVPLHRAVPDARWPDGA